MLCIFGAFSVRNNQSKQLALEVGGLEMEIKSLPIADDQMSIRKRREYTVEKRPGG